MSRKLTKVPLNSDVLGILFDHIFQMEPTEKKTHHIDKGTYPRRMDFPWILPASRKSLKSCSRVCRAWRTLAQRALFRCVYIDSEYFVKNLDKLEIGKDATLPFVVVDLRVDFPSPATLEMIKRSPHLKHLIIRYIDLEWNSRPSLMEIPNELENLSSLYIAISPEYTEDWDFKRIIQIKEGLSGMNCRSLKGILSKTPNLEKLVLSADFATHSFASRYRYRHPIKLPKLKCLEVHMLAFDDLEAYEWLFQYIDGLEHLALFDVTTMPELPENITNSVTKLWIHGEIKSDELGPAIAPFEHLEELSFSASNLAVQDEDEDPVTEIENFLAFLPGNIKTLRILDGFKCCLTLAAVQCALSSYWELDPLYNLGNLERLVIDLSGFTSYDMKLARVEIPEICKQRGIKYELVLSGNPPPIEDTTHFLARGLRMLGYFDR